MKSSIMLYSDGNHGGTVVEYGKFPGGEVYLKDFRVHGTMISVVAGIEDMDGLFALALLSDHLNRMALQGVYQINKTLTLNYLPYARQDRVKVGVPGNGALSLKIACEFINSMNWDLVTVVDPHSDVATSLLDRVRVIPRTGVFTDLKNQHFMACDKWKTSGDIILVSPDAGALKHTYEIGQKFGYDVVVAEKVRDMATGNILRTCVQNVELLQNRHMVIVDDIVDGGRTFIEIARAVEEAGVKPKSKVLFSSVGIYSKGKKCLTDVFDVVECRYRFNTYKEME